MAVAVAATVAAIATATGYGLVGCLLVGKGTARGRLAAIVVVNNVDSLGVLFILITSTIITAIATTAIFTLIVERQFILK